MIDNIKSYKDLSSDAKQARKAFNTSVCTGCFINKSDKVICDETMYAVCINAYTKGFVRGVKHHRKVVKNKNKKL